MIIYDFIYSFLAAFFFSFLFNAPRRSILLTATIAGIGYTVFIIFRDGLNNPLLGYFIGTLIMALLSEIAARFLKMAATTFITIAILPLVPGLGLYLTMQYWVQNNYQATVQTGTQTMLAIGAMAMAIAVNSLLVKFYLRFRHSS